MKKLRGVLLASPLIRSQEDPPNLGRGKCIVVDRSMNEHGSWGWFERLVAR